MKTKHTDSVQNRFTAYLMAALGNTRRKYWERKYRLQGMEAAREDLLERNYTDFEEQYRAYIRENTDFIFQDWQRYGELLALLESDRLAKAISRLKDRDRELLFARVYGGLAFAELGERFGMEPKQAEMAYYYVLRKLRKEMNGNDGFEKLLERAKAGDEAAQEAIFRMYRPLLVKNAMEQNVFEEDLYQEFSATLLNCIKVFKV